MLSILHEHNCCNVFTILNVNHILMMVLFIKSYFSKWITCIHSLWVRIPLRRGVLDTTLCDKVCQWLAPNRWFSPGTPVSSTNKTDRHNITEILLKVAFNTIILTPAWNLEEPAKWYGNYLKYYRMLCLVRNNRKMQKLTILACLECKINLKFHDHVISINNITTQLMN